MGSLHAGPSAQPTISTSKIFPNARLQSRFHQIFPFSSQNKVNWGNRGDHPKIFFIEILIFLLFRTPCKISKLKHKPFWEKQPISAFVRSKSAFLGGQGGSPKFFFSLESSYFCQLGAHAKFQNCSTNPSGRNSPFRLLSAQNRLFWGARAGPQFFLSYQNPNIFVTQEPMKNFKIVGQTLLGETAHFGFCPPKWAFLRGQGGPPKFVFH